MRKFLITEEEKKRIIRMHEFATKKHYLIERPEDESEEKFKDPEEFFNDDHITESNGIYSLNLNFDLRDMGAEIKGLPDIDSFSHNPFCFVSTDKGLLEKLVDYLNNLSENDYEDIRLYDGNYFGKKTLFLKPSNISVDEPFSEGMVEISPEDYKMIFSGRRNNEIHNQRLFDKFKDNIGKVPYGKVFAYWQIYNDSMEVIEAGVDVTEGLVNFLQTK
jgi:hypothetical protein